MQRTSSSACGIIVHVPYIFTCFNLILHPLDVCTCGEELLQWRLLYLGKYKDYNIFKITEKSVNSYSVWQVSIFTDFQLGFRFIFSNWWVLWCRWGFFFLPPKEWNLGWRGEVFMADLWVLGFLNWSIKGIWVSFHFFLFFKCQTMTFVLTHAFVNLVHFICDLWASFHRF